MNAMKKLKRGLFIVIEGVDGVGKTSVCNDLKKVIEKKTDKKVMITKETAYNYLSSKIVDLILNKKMDKVTELFLFLSCRRQHYLDVIAPELFKGTILICDRFTLSTYVYQGGIIEENVITDLNSLAIENFIPDITFFLDASTYNLKKRISKKQKDRFERKIDVQFYVKEYKRLLKKYDDNTIVIDSNKSLNEVVDSCWAYMQMSYPENFSET
ncbi:dTMP kinase [Enterococcus ureasiticus]|nr:dTMP kinase [Enterococcus ureasiticus]